LFYLADISVRLAGHMRNYLHAYGGFIQVEGRDVAADPNHVSVAIRDLQFYTEKPGRGVMDHARLTLLGSISPVGENQVAILIFIGFVSKFITFLML
jgi:hypothetical protein